MSSNSEKLCSICKIIKPLNKDNYSRFSNNRNGKITVGFRNICRKCMAERANTHDRNNPHLVKERRIRRQDLFKAAGQMPS